MPKNQHLEYIYVSRNYYDFPGKDSFYQTGRRQFQFTCDAIFIY